MTTIRNIEDNDDFALVNVGVEYKSISFENVDFSHYHFICCTFDNCVFINCKYSNKTFVDCNFPRSITLEA